MKMTAEILFLDPDDVAPASAALVEHGFDVEVLDDWIDEEGPTVFVMATTTTIDRDDEFLGWVQELVEPLGGDCHLAGPAESMALHRASVDRAARH